MQRDAFRALLERVREGRLSVSDALEELRGGFLEEVGFATLDLQRAARRGFPEVVYAPGKTAEQIVEIVRRLRGAGQAVLVTRLDPSTASAVRGTLPEAHYEPEARMLVAPRARPPQGRPGVVVVSAGTADLPVAEEAALTAEALGSAVSRVFDVGVAGIHRLVRHRDLLLGARAIVAVAGMEGALPSVVAGLTACPVIGVPTSTGYGSGAGGVSALLAMLSSCSPGVTVVNIDNGFGAGYAAALIDRAGRPAARKERK